MKIYLTATQKTLKHSKLEFELEICYSTNIYAYQKIEELTYSILKENNEWIDVTRNEENNYERNSNWFFKKLAIESVENISKTLYEIIKDNEEVALSNYLNKVKVELADQFEIIQENIERNEIANQIDGKSVYVYNVNSCYHFDFDYKIICDIEQLPVLPEEGNGECDKIDYENRSVIEFKKENRLNYEMFYLSGFVYDFRKPIF